MLLFVAIVLLCLNTRQILAGVDIEKLISEMTLEEKIGQLIQIDINPFIDIFGNLDLNRLSVLFEHYKIGSMMDSPSSGRFIGDRGGWTAANWRKIVSSVQNLSMTTSKIPIMYGLDAIHGSGYVVDATVFPQPLAMAATFNVDLVYKAAAITSKDSRAAGIPWVFYPVLEVALQPLWPRFMETFGG